MQKKNQKNWLSAFTIGLYYSKVFFCSSMIVSFRTFKHQTYVLSLDTFFESSIKTSQNLYFDLYFDCSTFKYSEFFFTIFSSFCIHISKEFSVYHDLLPKKGFRHYGIVFFFILSFLGRKMKYI